jgi:hypothetical protein
MGVHHDAVTRAREAVPVTTPNPSRGRRGPADGGPLHGSRLGAVKGLLIAAVVGLLTAVGAHATPSPSGLRGTVTRGPISPVCVAEQPCSEPAPNVTLLFSRRGHITARSTTDATGKYRVRLAPGRYQVSRTAQPRTGRGFDPDHVQVLPGRFTRVDFSIDTGIR